MNHPDIIGNIIYIILFGYEENDILYANYCLRDDIGGQHVCL
jgi:hypothetical protein